MKIYNITKITSFICFIIASLIVSLVLPFQAQTAFADTNTKTNQSISNQQGSTDTDADTSTNNDGKPPRLLVVPLDNRPANTYYPLKVGQAGGAEVIIPPQYMINYQTAFSNLDQLSAWILENSKNVDGFIISADMITDGGLVDSRTSKQTLDGALKQLEIIKTLKEKYPTKPMYVYDTIQRLAPTVLQDGNLDKYNYIRNWAITVDEVTNLNRTDLAPKLLDLEAKIGKNLLNEYLQIRERNSQINATLIDWTEQGYIDFLILGQDDANQTGLHRKEKESLIQKINAYNIQDKVHVFDGADEVDVILISRFLSTLKNYQPSYKIHYLGISGQEWISPFDHYTLQSNIEKHVMAAGGVIAYPYQQADIELYVNTPDSFDKSLEIEQAVAEMNNQIASGKHVVFIDVENVNQANPAFGDALINDVGITNLLSYSAFNTAGNAVGVAIGHANARFLYLEKGPETPELDEQAAKGHIEFLLNSIATDHLYRNKVQSKIEWYIRSIGANAWDIDSQKSSILSFTREQLNKEFVGLQDKMKNNKVLLSKKSGETSTAEFDSFVITKVDFPWNRLFEIEYDFIVKIKRNDDLN